MQRASAIVVFLVGAALLGLAGPALALDAKQEAQLRSVVERLPKYEEKLAQEGPSRAVQMGVNTLKFDLGKLPADDPKVKPVAERLAALEASMKAAIAGATKKQEPAENPPAAPAAAELPYADQKKLAALEKRIAQQVAKLEPGEPERGVVMAVESIGQGLDEIPSQAHAQVVAVRAKLEALKARVAEVDALAARRAEDAGRVKDHQRRATKIPELRGTGDEQIGVYLEDVKVQLAAARDAASFVQDLLKRDPKIHETKAARENSLEHSMKECLLAEKAIAAVDQRLRAEWAGRALAAKKEAEQALGAREPGLAKGAIARALSLFPVARKLAPGGDAELEAAEAATRALQAKAGIQEEELRIARRDAHRFPRALVEGSAAEAIRATVLDLWAKRHPESKSRELKRFAITSPGWKREIRWEKQGDAWVGSSYEWLIVNMAFTTEDPAVLFDQGLELRRTPGATDFYIHQGAGSGEMLAANLENP